MGPPEESVKIVNGESERLKEYLTSLPQKAWSKPSACDLWEVRDYRWDLTWAGAKNSDVVGDGDKASKNAQEREWPA